MHVHAALCGLLFLHSKDVGRLLKRGSTVTRNWACSSRSVCALRGSSSRFSDDQPGLNSATSLYICLGTAMHRNSLRKAHVILYIAVIMATVENECSPLPTLTLVYTDTTVSADILAQT